MMNYLFTKTPLLFFTQSFWRDEAFSYLMAQLSFLDILQITVQDFNPPLYYILLHVWILITGSSEIALRSLSLIFYGLTVYIAYDILTQICKIGKIRSLFYLVFFLMNPLLIYYAFEARMYSMVTFFAALSFYSFYLNKRKLYIFATICGLYTHYFMVFVPLCQFTWSLLYKKPTEKLTDILMRFIIPVLAFVPWGIYLLSQKQLSGEKFWIPTPILKDVLYLPSVLYTGFEKDFARANHGVEDYTNITTWILCTILAIIGAFIVKRFFIDKKRSMPAVGTYLLLWAFLPPLIVITASFFMRSTYLPRYIMLFNVGLILVLIYALEQLQLKIRVLLIVMLLLFTNSYQKLNMKYREKADFAAKAQEIEYRMKRDDLIYVNDERDFHTSRYYFKRDDIYIYGKDYDDIPSYAGKVIIPEENIRTTLPMYPRKAYIIRHNNGYEIRTQM